MCGAELSLWITRIKEELDGLSQRHNNDGGYICEICLKHVEFYVRLIREEMERDKASRAADNQSESHSEITV